MDIKRESLSRQQQRKQQKETLNSVNEKNKKNEKIVEEKKSLKRLQVSIKSKMKIIRQKDMRATKGASQDEENSS